MSSETDQPRQRTVAELLAAHGGQAAATGRRRRRREADETPEAPASGEPPATTALPRTPPPAPPPVVREQSPDAPRWTPQAAPAREARNGSVRENPTDVIPRLREPIEDLPAADRTSRLSRRGRPLPDEASGGPSTMVGMAPAGAEDWHAARTGPRRGGTAIDGGPPLPGADAGPAGLGPVDLRKPADDHADDRYDDEDDHDDAFESPPPRERRLGRSAREATSTAWGTVLMQWLAGALGGAVLWVAFRFLWRSLPVVAVAAAIAVTIGLVLVVRALLHNDDRRTTVFAVLVGLLLTVSPAILVLLGR